MLDPNSRSLLVDSLRPPPGYIFSAGVATTYSLDLTTLLSVPLNLALRSNDDRNVMLQDGVALLEALRRTTDRLFIFCQQGRINAPNLSHVLYGLLEPCVVEVTAPHGGVFHPKMWVLRFEGSDAPDDVVLRLLVLSRNLTGDRSWDLSLSLEGRPGKRAVTQNRPLADLVAALPNLATSQPLARVHQECKALADELRQTTWAELPGAFEDLAFHTLGLKRHSWSPKPSRRLAVISPFVTASALHALAASTQEPVVLVSRPDELARVSKASLARFGVLKVLHEATETDDGDDALAADRLTRGLHAKAYIAENGWDTTLYLGSANATNASLVAGSNVEILAALTGKRSRVGGIDSFLGEEGLGEYLTEFQPPEEPPPLSVEEQAEKIIDAARADLMLSGIRLSCSAADEDTWDLLIFAERNAKLKQIESIRIWPVSLPKERAVDGAPLGTTGEVLIPRCATASITGFVAFELTTALCSHAVCFVLNLPVDNIPEGRDAAVLRTIIANREGFLRYLLLLLQDMDSLPPIADLVSAIGGKWNAGDSLEGLPLLEELTRAYSRNPDRLDSVRKLVEQLNATPEGNEIIPTEFMDLWRVFDSMLKGGAR
ncbi:MAG: phospholipase D family protein [Acidobacteriaceae bacterium]|jgi:hypothetical protein